MGGFFQLGSFNVLVCMPLGTSFQHNTGLAMCVNLETHHNTVNMAFRHGRSPRVVDIYSPFWNVEWGMKCGQLNSLDQCLYRMVLASWKPGIKGKQNLFSLNSEEALGEEGAVIECCFYEK